MPDPAYFQEHIFVRGHGQRRKSLCRQRKLRSGSARIVPFRDIGSGTSAAGYFDLDNSGSLIQLYYHTGATDTVAKVFNLTFGQNFGDPGLSFNKYDFDYSSAQFDLSMMDTVNGESVTYVQGGSGVRTYLKFPGLDTLIDRGYSINRAELSVEILQVLPLGIVSRTH